MSRVVTVGVRILDGEYAIRCQEAQIDDLMESARSVDQQLQRMRAGGTTETLDRLAIAAALNIACDHLLAQRRLNAAKHDVRKLNEHLDRAIAERRPRSDQAEPTPQLQAQDVFSDAD